jgi:type II secretory pathway component PulC
MMLRQRLAALTPRERAFLGVGAAAFLAFLLYLMLRGGEEGPVELTMQPPPPAPVAAPVSYAPPPPPPPAPIQPAQPAASATGLTLIGVFGGGPGGGAAVIGMKGGVQRTIPVGRQFQPGLTLKAVGIDYVILGSASGDQKLELGKSGTTPVASAPVAAPVAPAGSGAPAQSEATRKAETNAYRIGLEPVKANGAITGHRIRAGAKLPHLDRAGLVPGDVILGVNGSTLTEEQLMELSWTIANSTSTEFEVMRGGRKIKLALQP